MLKRRMELNHYALLLSVKEIYHDGYVVIGTPDIGTRLAVGDEVVVCGKRSCYRTTLVSMQIEDRPVPDTSGDGATEVGLRLSKRLKRSICSASSIEARASACLPARSCRRLNSPKTRDWMKRLLLFRERSRGLAN
jgi:hypothetical protein